MRSTAKVLDLLLRDTFNALAMDPAVNQVNEVVVLDSDIRMDESPCRCRLRTWAALSVHIGLDDILNESRDLSDVPFLTDPRSESAT